MKRVLLDELKKAELDLNAVIPLIRDGVPEKKFGFIKTGAYKEIGLFELNNGYNIFHILAQKKALSQILPVIMNNAGKILTRELLLNGKEDNLEEKAKTIILSKLVESDNKSYNPVHYCIKDLSALKLLAELGVDFTIAELKIKTPLEMIIQSSRYKEVSSKSQNNQNQPNLYKEVVEEIYKNSDKQENMSDIHNACWSEVLYILEKGANISSTSRLILFIKNHALEWKIDAKTLVDLCPVQTEKSTIEKNFQPIISFITNAVVKSNTSLIDIFDPKNTIPEETRTKIVSYIMTGELIAEKEEIKVQKIETNEFDLFQPLDDQENITPNSQQKKPLPIVKKIEVKKVEGEFLEYSKKVLELINSKAKKQTEKDLKGGSNDLLKIVSVATGQKEFFPKLLKAAAKESNYKNFETECFLTNYLQNAKQEDLIFKSGNEQTGYELACSRDDLLVAKLLLAKGVEIELYTKGSSSIFDAPVTYGAKKVFNYLISNEQKDIAVDWSHILFNAIKYARQWVVESYINSKAEVIEEARTSSDQSVIAKYTILNKALKGIDDLLTIKRFSNQQKELELVLKSFTKSLHLMKCLDQLIEADKIFYSEKVKDKNGSNFHILNTTKKLLKQLKVKQKELSKNLENFESSDNKETIEKVTNGLGSLSTKIINKYEILLKNEPLNPLREEILNLGNEDKNGTDTEQLTIVTHFSALSQIDNSEFKVEPTGENNDEN